MQPQASILQVFRMEIPMFVMTIIWPIVFAALNLINDKVRIAHQMFYTIIGNRLDYQELNNVTLVGNLSTRYTYIPSITSN